MMVFSKEQVRIYYLGCLAIWKAQAIEEYLLNTLKPKERIIYLWQSIDAVVIGKNQNPWQECRLDRMLQDGVQLARRLSGGGAVFHDRGNLNFSFINGKDDCDRCRQSELVLAAIQQLGIPAYLGPRYILMVEGRKFSGNAFCFRRGCALHHGTLLIKSELQRLSLYLQPTPLSGIIRESRAVQSIPAATINLSECKKEISIASVVDVLIKIFRDHYDREASLIRGFTTEENVEELYRQYASWDWQFACTPRFIVDYPLHDPCMRMEIMNGRISNVMAYRQDQELAATMDLIGCRFNSEEMKQYLLHLS